MKITPKEGELKDCAWCGEPAEFKNRALKPSKQSFQVGDYIPPAPEFQASPGWSCTVCDHFEPLKRVDDNHIRELAERHTYEHKGVRYQIALVRVRFDTLTELGVVEPIRVHLDFAATPSTSGDPTNVSLTVSIENAADDAYILDAIDYTIRKIVDGELPPGTRELL